MLGPPEIAQHLSVMQPCAPGESPGSVRKVGRREVLRIDSTWIENTSIQIAWLPMTIPIDYEPCPVLSITRVSLFLPDYKYHLMISRSRDPIAYWFADR